MEWTALFEAVMAAESILCERGDYGGFTVGAIWADFPDEVLSGRLQASAKGRDRTSKVIRSFTKLAQAAVELRSAVEI